MKEVVVLLIILLLVPTVLADDAACQAFCEGENYSVGLCRETTEEGGYCEGNENEVVYDFTECEDLWRCCCSPVAEKVVNESELGESTVGAEAEPVEEGAGISLTFVERLGSNWHYIAAGLLVLLILVVVYRRKERFHMPVGRVTKAQPYPGLERFVRKSWHAGRTEASIRNVLNSQGWPKDVIARTIDRVKNERERKIFGIALPGHRTTEEDRVFGKIAGVMNRERKEQKQLQSAIDQAMSLKEKEEKFLQLKEEMKADLPKIMTEDVKKVLRVTDDLLGKMPEDMVDDFVHSPDFETYKKVMKRIHQPLKSNKDEGEKLEKVLTLLDRKVIDMDEARTMLGLSVRKKHARPVAKKSKQEVLDALKEQRHED